jgi:putative ABC transport system substrate-binding protein
MRRRKFIAMLGSAAVWPVAARGQQRREMPMVGYLHLASPETNAGVIDFRKGLSEGGYEEGRNLTIEYRYAHDQPKRLPDLAAELVRRRVSVIATPGSLEAAIAAKAATKTIPIVFATSGDPVQFGLVTSLNRPGGNVTGIAFMTAELGTKFMGLLHELLPQATRFAVLVNPSYPSSEPFVREVQAAAASIGGRVEVFTARDSREINIAFATLAQTKVDGLLVGTGPLFYSRRVQLVVLGMRHAIPAIYTRRENVESGGLMSYGSNVSDQFRQSGIYTARILKGETVADIPVMQPTKFEFLINLQTSEALGIKVPPGLLAIADEVIE